MKTTTHVLDTKFRRCTMTITEHPDRIDIEIRSSKPGILGDENQWRTWAYPLVSQFENDTRPINMIDPHLNRQATILTCYDPKDPNA